MSTNRNVIRSPTSSPERPAESTDRDDRPSGTRRRRSSSEARHRESLKYWLEKKQRLQGGSGSDGPASIVTSDQKSTPTDSTYRGRSSVRSRIGSVQAERDRGSPIQTRRSGRHPSSSAADTAAAPASPSKEDNNDDGSVPRGLSPAITPPPPFVHPPLPSKSRSRSKRVKSAATTPSVHDDVKRTPSSSAKRRRIFSKKAGARASRRPAAKRPRLEPKPFPLSPSPSDDDLPTTLEGMKARLAEVWKKRPAPRMSLSPSPPPPTRLFKKPDYNIKFFDDEAVEEEESDASASDMVPDGDEYDLEDPFIDDTAFIEDTDVSMDSDGYAGRARLTPVDNERDDYSSDRDTRPLRGPLPADDDIWRYADGTPYIPESDVSMDSDGNPFVKERDYMFKEETPSSRKGATNLSHRSNNRGGSSSSKKPSPRYRDDRRSRAHRASSPPKRTARPVHYRRSAEKNGGRRRQVAEHGDIKKDVVEISSDSEGNVVERSSSRGPSTKKHRRPT
ncbi:hypothetical protein DFP72DRAFT_1078548 [Ephemerocybe angulata]|uniref:Uncharacterized protein n=1 Tax=Ephemerocybe angulata TaxID=980116 RepID=A0A8H6LUM4_9AGAR|nr:hypothetical protein DFP72DRAFT_1078548 [Tulosesus angulatus]